MSRLYRVKNGSIGVIVEILYTYCIVKVFVQKK